MSELKKRGESFFSKSWWTMNGSIILATWLCYEGKIDGAGWVTAVLGFFAAWQGRGWQRDKLNGG